MAVKVNSNIKKQAKRLGKMSNPETQDAAMNSLKRLMTANIPLFAGATPKKTGRSAASITIESDDNTLRMQWNTDYIDDVNNNPGKSEGFANNFFKSVANRIQLQGSNEISIAYFQEGKKNKLKVRKT
tara:strand:+ start:1590 stop:1973 length:384 start_codon:yes stop_codon:yes gene_type:complete